MYCHTHIHTLYSWRFTHKRIQTGGFGFPELGVDSTVLLLRFVKKKINFQGLTSYMDGERGKKGKREIPCRRVTQTTLKV